MFIPINPSLVKAFTINSYSEVVCCVKLRVSKMISERRRSTRTIKDDEHLAEEVRKYTCLYDKTDKGYKEKERVTEAWKAIEETLGYEEGIE